ncbi:MAG: Bax inhibitor-1/YccA family protein [Propionibacteriaceae bacterium]|jgi:uncharacterized YccA/Bax inhibitor family protein|nr:Bax inhibitor-1/YccA family protein [Propionibacteriaceae bacterium]
MLRSNNPVLSRSSEFQAGYQSQPGQPYQQYQQPYQGYQGYQGQVPPYDPQGIQDPAPAPVAAQTMTIDDVLTKSAVTMGTLILVAAATMVLLPLELLWPVTAVTGLVAFGTVLLVSFRRAINPAFVLAYSAVEGVFIGAISKTFEYVYPGIVMPAVLGTFVTAVVTLAAYKYLRVRVSGRLRKMVIIGTTALCGVYLLNFVLSLFGVHLGVVEVGPGAGLLAMAVSAIGVVLAVLNLIMDFELVENGIRNQLPASESWRAAFGITVTMVWLYTELLRILSYFQRS